MSYFARIGESMVLPLVGLWEHFLEVLPYVLGGLLVAIFGFLLGAVVEAFVVKALRKFRFDEFMHKLEFSRVLKHFDHAHLIGVLLKWYIFVVFLVPAASMARLGTLSVLLIDFARWVPHLMLAILIVLFGWIGIDILVHKIESMKMRSRHVVAVAVQTILFAFVVVIALEQIGINLTIVQQTFLILLAGLSLGLGIALGIGFGNAIKDDAKRMIKDVRKKMK
ncbi:MAG: mechanosensitive ion channel family protein [Candidatus Woesearchaeota archaeon]